MTIVSYRITGFRWSGRAASALLTSIAFTAVLLLSIRFAPEKLGLAIGFVLTAAASAWSLSNLNRALGMSVFSVLRQRFLTKSKKQPEASHAHSAQ